ncbi:hypothetical protein [Leptolyngbya sp. AN10]|uniref:hypothetical protein n=1 Tax=Leptolyngbya sp. AN10 TaxID=3423365 RepID=UPI003D3123AE
MTQPLTHYAYTPRLYSLAELWGNRLESLTIDDKLSLTIILSWWLKSDSKVEPEVALLRYHPTVSDAVYQAVILLQGLETSECKALLTALVEQICDRDFTGRS